MDLYRDVISTEEPLSPARELPSEEEYDLSFLDSRLTELPFDEPQDPSGTL